MSKKISEIYLGQKHENLNFYGGCELLYALSDLRFIIILDSGRGMSFERIAILKQIIPMLTVTESILRTEEIYTNLR